MWVISIVAMDSFLRTNPSSDLLASLTACPPRLQIDNGRTWSANWAVSGKDSGGPSADLPGFHEVNLSGLSRRCDARCVTDDQANGPRYIYKQPDACAVTKTAAIITADMSARQSLVSAR